MTGLTGRHAIRLAIALTLLLAAGLCIAQSVAFTFDDGPSIKETPLLSPEERNLALLAALEKHHVQAALFVTSGNGANTARGLELARAWGLAGHAIGNHTVTHPDLNSDKVTLQHYQQEVLDCDQIIRNLPGYQKWFRYTYLREGNTPEKRDGMRQFLKDHGYRNAYVSLDTSDWRLDAYLIEALNKDSHADLTPIKQAYLAHIKQRALAYHALSLQLQGRDIPQIMLMHHNLINALWLDDAITQFENMGWTITTPQAAFADPVYQLVPDRPAPGQSLLLSMARSLGLDQFPGRERLVDDGDLEINLLNAQINAQK